MPAGLLFIPETVCLIERFAVILGYAEGVDRADHDEGGQDDEIQFDENWEKVIIQILKSIIPEFRILRLESQPQNAEVCRLP